MWAILWKYNSDYKIRWLNEFLWFAHFIFFSKIIAENIMFKMNFKVRGKSHMTWQFNFSWVSTFCAPQFAIIIGLKVRYGYKTTFFAELFLKGSSSRESKMFRKNQIKMIVYLSNFLKRIINRSYSLKSSLYSTG